MMLSRSFNISSSIVQRKHRHQERFETIRIFYIHIRYKLFLLLRVVLFSMYSTFMVVHLSTAL
jgi:hypothetical protein